MTDTVDRFSNRVANYVRYRPHYPLGVVEYLKVEIGLTPEAVIADIGCGTGISSELFLQNGNRVIGVEPNEKMLAAAIEYLGKHPWFRPVSGTAERTTLDDASVDLVVAGQAFHWFDQAATKAEFKRILKTGGHVVLIWNERKLDTTPFLVEYEKLLVKYSTDYNVVRHDKFSEEVLDGYFDNGVKKATFSNVQELDLDGLRGRMLSASYVPNDNDPRYPELAADLDSLFAKHNQNGRISILYDTNVYVSQG